jgi:hypothetical protein
MTGRRSERSQTTPSPRQRELAQADLAGWLAFPTELEVEPDEIELLRTVEVPMLGEPGDLFVFRFRTSPPHWAADKGWMVGVAGPFARSKQPSATGGFTFSKLTQEDAMTIEEHIDDLIENVASWQSGSRSAE